MQTTTQNRSTVVASIVRGGPLSFIYEDLDGVVSARRAEPRSIERCRVNGETIVRAFDVQRNAPRSFRLDRILRMV